MPRKKKTYGKTEASECYEMLRRFATQFHNVEQTFYEAYNAGGNEAMLRLAQKEHERYNAMLEAATILVRAYDL